MSSQPTPTGSRLPASVLFSLAAWGLLLLAYIIDREFAGGVAAVLAGGIVALGFAMIGWYVHRQGFIPEEDRLTRRVAQQAVPAHIVYGSAVLLVAAAFGGRAAFGIDFSDVFPVGTLLAGALLGLFAAAGLELDAGFAAAGEPSWYSVLFAGIAWSLLVIVFAAAGGLLFALTLIVGRFLLSLVLHQWHLWSPKIRGTGGEMLAVSLLVLPVAAFLTGL